MISKLVLYPIGVTKLMFAPNNTDQNKRLNRSAQLNGDIDKQRVVPKTAAALFEPTFGQKVPLATLKITNHPLGIR
jgi:hypothetical protein